MRARRLTCLAEQGTENLSVVYDQRGPRPVNAIIENGRSVTQLMGILGLLLLAWSQITGFAGNMGWGSSQRRLSLRERRQTDPAGVDPSHTATGTSA